MTLSSLAAGGTERVLAMLAGALQERGHQVFVVTDAPATSDHYPLEPGIRRITLGLPSDSGLLWSRVWRNFLRVMRLRSEIRTLRPTAVIAFGDTANVRAVLAGIGTGIPVVVSERTDPRENPQPWALNVLRRLLYPRADAVVAQTQSVAAWIGAFVQSARVRVIPNPVRNLSATSLRPNALAQRNTAVAVGRLGQEKGFDVLLDAYARSKLTAAGWQLVILGDGPERDALQRRIDELGLQGAVLMPGVVKNTEQWLQHAQLFVLSSRFEGFPNALLEAMQCGLPVAAFDCPSGPGEIVRHEQTGLLVPAGDVEALAAAIARLAGDADLRQRLGSAAAADVSSRFSLQHIGSMWEELLVGIAGQTR
jgi:GalNAc-alpha-(1->4)-GalNAc-alpha-(1->3)-diNAcBac-PP-undecaprenol alpha-1,4-N-acetyl-D-galactosaminyltransferase